MGSFSLMHWVVVLAIVVLLFGAGKIPRLMGDVAKGIKNFKEGMKDENAAASTAVTPASTAVPPSATPPQQHQG
jgi:sec-independent protein translocase protein TatA